MRRLFPYGVAAVIAVSMAGCHGGSSSMVPSVLSGPGATQALAAPGLAGSVSFTVTVPPGGSGSFIPQSLVVSLLSGAGPKVNMAPVTLNLNSSVTGCSALSAGGLKCTVSVSAPSGADTFSITTFSRQNGTGTKLSTAQAQTTVSPTSATKTACVPKSTDLATLQSAH